MAVKVVILSAQDRNAHKSKGRGPTTEGAVVLPVADYPPTPIDKAGG